ncbi:peptidoglycan DD-metalloendopeptidase family protein [Candidatus Kaiserbacteria bacterium]|nr:peptidoglycan DD-metalloendopeptidase family protein [Candidatus Kaiserbacteria bacterium]
MTRAALSIGVALAIAFAPVIALAQTADELRAEIAQHNTQIDALNKEIAQYQVQLDKVSAAKQTLQSALAQLDLSIKKVTASINLIKNQIGTTELEIKQLQGDIAGKQSSIQTGEAGLAESVRRINELEKQSFALQMLSSGSISSMWQDIDEFASLQSAVDQRIKVLATEKQQLTDTKTAREHKEAELKKQRASLVTQQGSLTATKRAQSDLLAQTKSQESTFQKIIAQKKAQEADFEAALQNLQGKLRIAVDPSQITPGGKGILNWPFSNVRITQYFGNTAFAQSGAYNGKGHNGIDFAASIGTPIQAALAGIVIGTGNTDTVRGCYSFGKWVMIKHSNGLNTMYAHLSQISVSEGQSVATGEVVGYSGETGYATGPHLHFGVYVSSATQIITLASATNQKTPCANAVMPIAPLSGYLNPMNYL